MRSTEEEIFLEQNAGLEMMGEEIHYRSGSSENQNEYLSQFLNSQGSQHEIYNDSVKSEQPKSTQIQNASERLIFTVRNKENVVKNKKRQKSCFHNFQKHLVITLRNVIKLKKSFKNGETESIAYEMWSVFANSSLFSKKFLHVLFGVHGGNEDNEFSKSFLDDLGFMEVFAKYSEDNIREAQDYLRKQTIKQFQKINLREYLTYRKLKRANEFQTYIQQFLGQLKQGCIRKRLPKQRKINMVMLKRDDQTHPDIIG